MCPYTVFIRKMQSVERCGMWQDDEIFGIKFFITYLFTYVFSATCTWPNRFDSEIQGLSLTLKDSVEERMTTRTCSFTMMSENVHQPQSLPEMNEKVNYDLYMQ